MLVEKVVLVEMMLKQKVEMVVMVEGQDLRLRLRVLDWPGR